MLDERVEQWYCNGINEITFHENHDFKTLCNC